MLGKTGCSRLHPRSLFDGNTRRARDLLERDHPATGIRMERADGERFRAKRIPRHPVIERIKDTLYEGGALYAAMSGSGSSVFGLFEKPTHFKEQSLFSDCFLWEGQLS